VLISSCSEIFTLKRDFDDSDSPVVHYFHRLQDSIVGLFAETEHAQVLKEIKMLDPGFNMDEFIKEMQSYIIPEVLESFLHGKRKDLKEWCSEGVCFFFLPSVSSFLLFSSSFFF
jgi:import inner membrane translocase subunit TIM44